jgi:BlaI family transcriptional regulator, penicillinase repressor
MEIAKRGGLPAGLKKTSPAVDSYYRCHIIGVITMVIKKGMTMKRRAKVRPSGGEMAILQMLWQEGPLSLAEAHQGFAHYGRPVGYPTMQTRLNRLVKKKWLRRSDDRPARYAAAITPDEAAAGHLDQWLRVARQAQVAPLVAQLLSENSLTAEEIHELQRLLSEAEKSLHK